MKGLTACPAIFLFLIYINQFHVCFHKIMLYSFIPNFIAYFKGILLGLISGTPLASYIQQKRTGFMKIETVSPLWRGVQ